MLDVINKVIKDIITDTRNHYNHINNQITKLTIFMINYKLININNDCELYFYYCPKFIKNNVNILFLVTIEFFINFFN